MRNIVKILLFLGLAMPAFGQSRDSVILNALRDELKRNMTELRYEGFEKPFFISYTINDVVQHEIAASMGALLRSTDNRSRTKNVRVLVGDYEFNDESLDNNNFSAPEANEIELPLDDDYLGIRRSLWVTTDYVYKSAARQHKKNLEVLKEKNKKITDLPHRRFAKVEKQTVIRTVPAYTFNRTAFEQYVRNVSAVFVNYPAIENSTVFMSFFDGYSYLRNSEGTLAKTPIRRAALNIYAQMKTEEGEAIYDHIVHYAATPDEFPSVDEVRKQVAALCQRLTSPLIKSFDDEYTGPVLFTGEPVAETFAQTLFPARDGLVAQDMLPDTRGFRENQLSSAESKLGKLFLHESLSVYAKPVLKDYNGTTLFGAYDIDDEGVVPPASVTLVEKGILKGFLNNRSLLKDNEVANGHSNGPAVIEVSATGGVALKQLKEKLIAEAKRQGLDYGLMISSSSNDPAGGVVVTRIFVPDGKEETLRHAAVEHVNIRKLKDVLGATATSTAHNLQSQGGQTTSYIVPDAILLEELDVRRADVRVFKEERYVSNPLVGN